jgi:Bacterial Ig-like domain
MINAIRPETGNEAAVRPRGLSAARLLTAFVAVVLAAGALAGTAAGDVGDRDFTFGTAAPAPTSKEAQSKLWFNDGRWWGSLYNRTTGSYQIHRLDWATQTWTDSGTVIDDRDSSKSDVVWDGTHLYVVTAGSNDSSTTHNARVLRFSYSAATKTYTLDSGFPVTLATSGGIASERAITIQKDSTGTLWVTYTKSNKVYVTHSTTSDAAWVAPYVLPASGATGLLSQDESAIVAFNGKIGIMWSNQVDWSYRWATHVDGDPDNVWQSSIAHQATEESDNHINLKALQSDPAGQVFAALKTSLNAPNDTLYYLMVLKSDGTWAKHVFGRVSDDHTRAQVLIDAQNRELYMFATSPCCNGGTVYYKKTSLDNISFPVGKGTLLMQSGSDTHINNVTSTKQTVSNSTGLLVLASDDSSDFYVHNAFDLGSADTTPPETTIDSGPAGTVVTNAATFTFSSNEAGSTFACSLDGASFTACTSPTNYTGLSDGSHTFQVRATDGTGNTDLTPAGRTWTIDSTALPLTIAPDADARVELANPTLNFGSDPKLVADTSPNTESFLRFTISGLTGTVVSATLRLFATNGSTDGPAVYSAGNSWTETGITWNNKPARTGGALDNKGAVSTNSWVEYNVTGAVTANGTYTFNVVPSVSDATDFNARESTTGNKPELVVRYQADTNPPETTIDSGPSGTISSTSAAFAFSASESGSTFECKLDSGTFSACTSPKSYSSLMNGSHTFEVRATDAAGNTDLTPAGRTWTVDTVAPAAPVIESPPDGSLNTTGTVTVSGTAEPTSTVELFEGAASKGATAADAAGNWSKTLTLVAEGSHTYTAKASDLAGNTSAASNARTVIVDTTAPETTIDSGPSGTISSTSAAFAFSASEGGSTFECKLDSGTFSACTSPKSYSSLAEGAHTFQVRATDPGGHSDATPASRTWTVSLAIFSDGFEDGSFSAWSLVNTGGDGSATVQSSLVKTGTFAALLSETANTGSLAYVRKTFTGSQTDLRVTGNFRVLTEGASGGNVPFFRLFDSSGTRLVSLYRQNLSGDKVQVNCNGTTFITTGRLPLNTWGLLELHAITAGTGVSTVEVRLDGTLVYQSNTASLGTSGILTMQIGNETAKQTFTLAADDITARIG